MPFESSRTFYRVPMDRYLQRNIATVAQSTNISPNDLIKRFMQLGLLTEQLSGANVREKLYLSRGKRLERISLSPQGHQDEDGHPYANLENLTQTTPPNCANDLTQLLTFLKETSSNKLQLAPQKLQIETRKESSKIGQIILQRYGRYLDANRISVLQQIGQGIAVVHSLKELGRIDFGKQLPGMLGKLASQFPDLIKMIIDVQGCVMKPFDSVIFDSGSMGQSSAQGDHLKAHEIMHVVSESNLPVLLMEAATDHYASKALGGSYDPYQRMPDYYQAAEIWRAVESIGGQELAFQTYLNGDIVKITESSLFKRVLNWQFVDNPLHDLMRNHFGIMKKNTYKWDVALELIDRNDLRRAHQLLFN